MKSYTDLDQSKKLAEILSMESADNHYIMTQEDKLLNKKRKMIDKKVRKKIVYNMLKEYVKDNGLVEYNYSDGFYVFGNPDNQDMADKKHEEWLAKQKLL